MVSSLKVRSIKGISWTLLEKFGVQSVKFLLGIILARLLTPEDFGLIGIIMVFFILAQALVESGFAQAYVQKKDVNNNDANTVFYTNLVISIILYGVLYITAPYIAKFYGQNLLIRIVRIMGVVVIINAFSVIQIAQITRDVNFKRKTKIILVATFISGASGIISAYHGYGVWALVIQNMLQALITAIGLWLTSKWKPGLSFSISAFKEMFSYGFWILLAGLMQRVFDNIYVLTIGKFFPMVQAGYYVQAKKFQQLSSQQIVGAVGIVSFPVFSQLQDDKLKLQAGLRKFLKHTLMIMMPIQITLIVVAKPFVLLLLTEKWAPMIPYLQLLCIVGFLYPIHLMNIQVLKAQGKSNLNFRLNLLKNSLRLGNIFLMYRFGVKYIIIGEVVVSLFALLINTYFTHKLINYGFLKQFNDIKEILLGSIIVGFIGYFVSFELNNLWFSFLAGGFTTLLLFIIIQYLFNRQFFLEFIKLREVFKNE